MQNIHTKLTQKYQSYNNWHQTKHHNKIHWGVLILYSLFIFSFILNPLSFTLDSNIPDTSLKVSFIPLTSKAQTTLEIPLTIEEPAGIPRTNEPVTSGIPLPQGTIVNTPEWSLWDGATELPVQVTKLQGRTPWILLDFQLSLNANEKKTLTLKQIPSTTLSNNPLTISEDTNQITISNKIIKTTLSKTNFNLLEEVWLDKNNNQSFDQGEQIITSQPDNIQIIDSTTNKTFSGKGTPTKITWEYQGPLRSTLRVEGKYTNKTSEFIHYTTRITFYAERSDVKVEHVLRNSYQPNERHVKIKSATLTVGAGGITLSALCSGMENRFTCVGPIIAWANLDSSGMIFDLIPASKLSNEGLVLPDLSYHGATIVLDFQEGLSVIEQTRRNNAAGSPLFAIAPPSWYSENGNLSTSRFGTLEDEKQTYQNWGWTWTPEQEPRDLHKPNYWVSWKDVAVHDDSEADDLWQNLLMYLRTNQRGYWDRAIAWNRYYKWEYTYRTDGFDFAWDSDWENSNQRVSRPLIAIPLTSIDNSYLSYDVVIGRIDLMGWGADHLYGWGLLDYYQLSGDTDALEAASDIGEISERIFEWRIPGDSPMAYYGTRQGARHLLFISRLYEITQDIRWQNLMNHLSQLWLKSPDWDARGFYPLGEWSTDQKVAPGAYAAGARAISTFQHGLLSHALDYYHTLTGDVDARSRLIEMAQWVKNYAFQGSPDQVRGTLALDWPNVGEVWQNDVVGGGAYTISLVDTLVRGYRLSGDTTLLDQAKVHWDRGTRGLRGGNQVMRFINDRFLSDNLYYTSNRGDLTYAHLLFYDYANLGNVLPIDTSPPSIPTNVTATAVSSSQINISWTASTDNVGVAGYKIYRNGGLLTITPSSLTTYSDTGLTASTAYTHTISAYDAAGNVSVQSSSTTVTTLAVQGTNWTGTWTKLTPNGVGIQGDYGNCGGVPCGRNWVPGTYDSKRNLLVIFGGGVAGGCDSGYVNDLWTYSYTENTWTQVLPVKRSWEGADNINWPKGRDNHMLAYDDYNDVYWMYAGTCSEIVGVGGEQAIWAFNPNNKTWTKYPVPEEQWPKWAWGRYDSGFAYDRLNREIVVFGGEFNGQPYNDTWIFDVVSKQWTRGNANYAPDVPPRRYQVENMMTYDSFHKKIVIFGGLAGGDLLMNDTWTYDVYTNTWTKMNPPVSPSKRFMHPLVYDNKNKVVVLFGGSYFDDQGNGAAMNDTWVYDIGADRWMQVQTQGSPPPMGHHVMAYDPVNDVVLLWYGKEGTWALKLSSSISSSDTVSPTIPQGLTAQAISSSQINLSWTASTDDVGVTGYKIYRCLSSTCTPITQIATSTTNSYSDTGLNASTAYTYVVSAYDNASPPNESAKSSFVSVATLAGFKPSDLNQDAKVDQQDFDILKLDFNRTDKPVSDINQDGVVDSRDLGIMMSEWTR